MERVTAFKGTAAVASVVTFTVAMWDFDTGSWFGGVVYLLFAVIFAWIAHLDRF